MPIPPPPPGFVPYAPNTLGRPIIRDAPPRPAPQTPEQREAERLANDLRRRQLAAMQAAEDAKKITPEKKRDVRMDAVQKINTIRNIRALAERSPATSVGLGGQILRNIGGTAARDIEAQIQNLQAGGALAEVLKMSAQTGRNPFTPMSNSDVELISRNIGNLDQTQGLHSLIQQLDNYERAYGNAFVGAGGKPEALRDRNRADGPFPGKQRPQQRRSRVINFSDLPE